MLDALAIAVKCACKLAQFCPKEGFVVIIDWKDKTITMETLEWGEKHAVQPEG